MTDNTVHVVMSGDESPYPVCHGVYESEADAHERAEEIRDPDQHVQQVVVRQVVVE